MLSMAETSQSASRNHVCEIMAYCVRAHGYRMRYFVVLNNIVGKVLRFTTLPDKYLRLCKYHEKHPALQS